MQTLVNFLIIVILVYFGLRIFWRFMGPLLLRFILKRVQKSVEAKFVREQNLFQQKYHPEFESELNLNKNAKIQFTHGATQEKDPKETKPDVANADYVDFEEIK